MFNAVKERQCPSRTEYEPKVPMTFPNKTLSFLSVRAVHIKRRTARRPAPTSDLLMGTGSKEVVEKKRTE